MRIAMVVLALSAAVLALWIFAVVCTAPVAGTGQNRACTQIVAPTVPAYRSRLSLVPACSKRCPRGGGHTQPLARLDVCAHGGEVPMSDGMATTTASVPLHRNRDLVLWWAGSMVSGLGTGISSIAFPLLVLGATGSAAKAALVGVGSYLA